MTNMPMFMTEPGEKEARKYEIGISAVRGGNIVGEHEVIFAGQDEVIEFKHTAYSKAVFARERCGKILQKLQDFMI